MSAHTYRAVYCERFGLPPEAFEESLLWRCFYHRALLPGKIIWQLNRRYFQSDLELIRAVADCTSCTEVRAELDAFRYHQPNRGFWRKTLHIRLSGQRLVDTAAKLLG